MSNTRSKRKSDVRVVELSNYSSPEILEYSSNNKDYVTYGENNKYFEYINRCFKTSTTNRSIINNISRRIYGRGLDATNAGDYPKQLEVVLKLFKKKDLKKAAHDLKEFGQCALQVGYNKTHKKIIKVQHLPIETIALGRRDDKGEIKAYYYMANWNNSYRDEAKKIPAFGTSNKQVELLYISEPSSGNMYYSDVDYNAALPYCEMEKEISVFHLNNIKNGFTPSMLINFNNGVPTEKVQAQVENQVTSKFAGAAKAGKVIFAFNNNKEESASIEAVTLSDADKQYQFISKEAESKILMGHSIVSPILVGIRDGSGLGNNAEEMQNADALLNTNVIEPFQELLIDGIDEILEFNNLDKLDLYFKPLTPWIFTEENIDEVDEDTQDEVEKETGISTDNNNPLNTAKDEQAGV